METVTHFHPHEVGMPSEKVCYSVVKDTEIKPEMEFSEKSIDRSLSPELVQEPLPTANMTIRPFKRGQIRFPSLQKSARSSVSTSRRHLVSRGFSGGSLVRSYRSEASKELTLEGETQFSALMELIFNISRQSNSLKQLWMKLISERESCLSEMDKMQGQVEECTEFIESKEQEQIQQQSDHEEKKQEVEKLRLELSTVLASVNEYKKKLSVRDTDIGNTRRELHEYKEMAMRLRPDHDEMKRSLEATQLKLKSVEEERSLAQKDAEKHQGDLQILNQKNSELHASFIELTSQHESFHKEFVSVKQAKAALTKEKNEWLHTKSELDESLRKANKHCHESLRRIEELTESYDKKEQEVHKFKHAISKIEEEKDELQQFRDDLKRRVNEKHNKWEDAEGRCSKWKLKWEHAEQELASIRQEIHHFDVEKANLREAISKKSEEFRRAITEKNCIKGDLHTEHKKVEEHLRKVNMLQETIRCYETSLKEQTELIRDFHNRVARIEAERDAACSKCGDMATEIEQLHASVNSTKAEISTVNEKHEGVIEKLRESEARYDEVCSTMEEFNDDHGNFEYEITELRTMLSEAREQKEKAIEARNLASHERDEAVSRYEEKCRELERYVEHMSERLDTQYKSAGGGGRTFRRIFSKSSTSNELHHAPNIQANTGFED
jgi:chromosome segregation ATPase